MRKLLGMTKGASLVEYGTLIALIAVFSIGVTLLLGEKVKDIFGGVQTALSQPAATPPAATPPAVDECIGPPMAFWDVVSTEYNNPIWAVANNGSQWVALGGQTSFDILTSFNGSDWSTQTLDGGAGRAVAHDGTQWVAAGEGGTIYTSPDGIIWTERDSGTDMHIRSIAHDGTQWTGVGFGGSDGNHVVTSLDGVNWTSHVGLDDTGQGGVLLGIATDGNMWVRVNFFGIISTSSNGIDWIRQAPRDGDFFSVAHHGNQWVTVGTNGRIMTSPNGLDWTTQTSVTTNQLEHITHDGTHWVATGRRGTILYSTDGVNWVMQEEGSENLFAVYGTGEEQGGSNPAWVAVGDNGTILTTFNTGCVAL